MKHSIIQFEVREDKKEIAIELINQFVQRIKFNEPDTLEYRSFQEEDYSCRFTHTMCFKNEVAKEIHRSSAYCLKFVEELYPICINPPQVKCYTLVSESKV